MALQVATPPSEPIVGLADLKAYLHVDYDDDDALLTSLTAAAGEAAETMVQRRYAAQALVWIIEDLHRFEARIDRRRTAQFPFPMLHDSILRLPLAAGGGSAGLSIDGVTYTDLNGTTQTLDPSSYEVKPSGETLAISSRWHQLAFQTINWRSAEPLVVNFSVTSGVIVPQMVQVFVKASVKSWYDSGDISNVAGIHPLMMGEIWS